MKEERKENEADMQRLIPELYRTKTMEEADEYLKSDFFKKFFKE